MKQYRTLIHDIFAEIRKSRSRFLSILCIVFLGVGFFSGVKSTCPDMKETAQQYFEDQNLMDFQLKSTMGFTEGDIDTLRDQPGVEAVAPAYSLDAFVQVDESTSLLVRALSYELGSEDDPDALNQPVLKEGRWPEKEDECLVEHGIYAGERFQVGSQITLFLEEGDLSDALSVKTFTVVGVVESPLYINFERGSSTLGNGSVRSFLYLPADAFAYEAYTDVYLTYQKARGMDFYDDAYQEWADQQADRLARLATQREKTRHDEIYEQAKAQIDQAQQELDEGQAAYEAGKQEYEEGIAQGEQQLEQAKAQIDSGRSQLEWQQEQLSQGSSQYQSYQQQLQQQSAILEQAQAAYESGLHQLENLQQAFESARQLLESYRGQSLPADSIWPAEVEYAIESSALLSSLVDNSDLPALLREYVSAAEQAKNSLYEQLDSLLAQASAALEQQRAALEQSGDFLTQTRQQLEDGLRQLEQQGSTMEQGQARLAEARQQLEDAQAEYDEGVRQLEEQRIQGQQELDDAAAQLEEARAELLQARHDLNDLGSPEWYIFDRTNNPGYSSFCDDAERVDRVAAVFPVFFILVAALVCLTTMTRMVEEQRTQIGTLKALGYGTGAATAKYLVYALSASLLGSLLGLAVGFTLFPTVIFNAYRIMYIMPSCLTPWRWGYALGCTAVAMACTGLSAWAACRRELTATPAQLMRPRPPKTGKRVLLERVHFLWNRLSFLQKVTLRNLFRYKKRIAMTVVGIAGCTALMMAGFGLQYAISSIVDLQYSAIFHYDAMAFYDSDITADEQEEIRQQLTDDIYVDRSMRVMQNTMEITAGSSRKEIYLFVPEEPEQLDPFVTLRERESGQALSLPEEGMILTEKMARLLDVETGDTVTLQQEGTDGQELEIVAITENYTENFAYVSPRQYEASWEQEVPYNSFLICLDDPESQDHVASDLLENNNVLSVSFSADSGQQFRDIVGSLTYIVLVIIVCAGALAFVVLYNLANINVEERVREIATIKVLGFYDREVSAYIYRESILSSLLGIGVGLLLGIPFLRFIIRTAEVDAVMFNPALSPTMFLFSALLSLLFSLVVNLAMHFRLKKIDMVQSLKSIE